MKWIMESKNENKNATKMVKKCEKLENYGNAKTKITGEKMQKAKEIG